MCPAPAPPLAGLAARVVEFVHALRRAGVPVAISDDLDALRATALVDLLDRDQLRQALAATLISSVGHRPAFDTLFDLYFPARLGAGLDGDDDRAGDRDVRDLLAELVQRLLDGDDAAVRALAHEAVATFGRVDGRDGQPAGFYAYRVFREINTTGLLRRLYALLEDDGLDGLALRLRADELEQRIRRFREEVESDIRRRQAEQRGVEQVARTLVRALPEDVDFFRVTADEQAAMRRSVRPLARKLASRLAVRRKRARDGRLDVRRTLRRSLDAGGVPIDPAFRAKAVHRPELVLLCDVSGSVAAFSRFTLLFCHALAGQFSRVRSFAFVDTIDEVSRLFEEGDVATALQRLSAEAQVVWLDGHSDYGNAFATFHARHLDAITPRTTVLILGDGRNNYRAANTWALVELRRRARRVYWLNPEPRSTWGTGDSIADEYAVHIDEMVECRNLRQLAAFIERTS